MRHQHVRDVFRADGVVWWNDILQHSLKGFGKQFDIATGVADDASRQTAVPRRELRNTKRNVTCGACTLLSQPHLDDIINLDSVEFGGPVRNGFLSSRGGQRLGRRNKPFSGYQTHQHVSVLEFSTKVTSRRFELRQKVSALLCKWVGDGDRPWVRETRNLSPLKAGRFSCQR